MGTCRVLSNSSDPFENRIEAGQRLAEKLKSCADKNPVVLGIPRGGLIPAREIANALGGEMDVILAHKLGAPGNPELAIGAVVEGGKVFLDERILSREEQESEYIRDEANAQMEVIKKRAASYRAILPRVPLNGRVVIVTDDGAARGLTMMAALWAISHEKPQKLICALPVAPPDTVEKLAQYADEVLCLRAPEDFQALGQFYLRFDQVNDAEVLDILKQEAQKKHRIKGNK